MVVDVRRGGLGLRAVACRAGGDLTVTVTGGDRPHVGCVVLARRPAGPDEPKRGSVTSSVLTLDGHREEALARPLAERLAEALRATVVVAAGVHTEGLTPEGVATYLVLGDELAEAVLSAVASWTPSTPSLVRR